METTWVFCAGMRRSGGTLQYHMTRDILSTHDSLDLGWVTWQRFDELFMEHDGMYDYVVLKCHVYFPDYVSLFDYNSAKVITIHRDMRDAMSSMMRMRKNQARLVDNDFRNDVRATLNEFGSWAAVPGALVSRYDDVVNDLVGEVERIAEFLNVECDSYDIASRHSTSEQIARQPHEAWDKDTLLWPEHVSGLPAEKLSDERLEIVMQEAGDWLKMWGYT